ncbi:MAG: hypothetical protein JST16_00600 [Bdellovibrionales bacterium]|nr:hypothetical protein [Bdellovibrionales bacterium]
MLNTPQFLMCVASNVWGLTSTNYKDLHSFTLDLGAIGSNTSHACHGIIDLPASATSYSLKGKCWDLTSGDYKYMCKAVNASDNSFALEMAFTIASDSATSNYSGKGYLYSNIGGGGWFKWDITNGTSADVWGIKTDSPGPNYWSNYVHIHDDTSASLFSWQAILGSDSSSVSGMQGTPSTTLEYQSGVYNRSNNYARVKEVGYTYTGSSTTAFGASPWINENICATVSTTTNRVSGACTMGDANCNADSNCTGFSATALPDLIGDATTPNLNYLKKYESSGLTDGVNNGIRFSEQYSAYTVE